MHNNNKKPSTPSWGLRCAFLTAGCVFIAPVSRQRPIKHFRFPLVAPSILPLLPASKRALGITRGERRAPRYDEARARSNNTHHILSTAPDRIVANAPRSTAPQNNGPLLPCSSVLPPERVPIRRHHRRPFTFTPSRGRMAQSSLGRPCLRSQLRSCLLRLCLGPCLRWLATHLHVHAQSDAVESVGWRFAATVAGSVFRACVVCPRVSRARLVACVCLRPCRRARASRRSSLRGCRRRLSSCASRRRGPSRVRC